MNVQWKRPLAILSSLAVGLGAWLALPDAEPPGDGLGASAGAALAPPSPAPPPAGDRVSPSTAAAVPRASPATPTVELCGTGRFSLREGRDAADAFEALPAPVGRGALQELNDRLRRVLAAGDARQRVAAWLLSPPEGDNPQVQAQWASALLTEARTGGDAQALRWAAAACDLTDDGARCRRELARARVQAEPDNGLHWLEWGQEAASTSEQDEAWRGLVRAPHWREHPAGLTAVTQATLASMQPAAAGYLRARLARETQGQESAQAPAGLDWLERQCAERPVDCAQVAQRLFDDGDSAALLQAAAALGRQLGWTDERLQAVTTATQSFHAGLPRWREGPLATLSCDAVASQLAHGDAVALRGEVPR